MAKAFLIDTDVLIDVGRGVADAIQVLQQIERVDRGHISAITQMELLVGCRNKREQRILMNFLTRFRLVLLNHAITEQALESLFSSHSLKLASVKIVWGNLILRGLSQSWSFGPYRLSHGLLIPDALIAATAITKGFGLVSKNQKDYRFIAHLELLPYPEVS